MTSRTIKPIQSSIGLPAERLAQLRALADYHGVSAVEIVERAIRQGIEAGHISDELPGFADVDVVDDDLIIVSLRGETLPPIDRQQAHLIAAVLDAAAGKAPLFGLEIKHGSAKGVDLGHGSKLYIGRHAKAVTLALMDGRTGEITLRTATTASIAADFARILRREAAKLTHPVVDAATGEPTEFLRRVLGDRLDQPDASAREEAR